MPEHEIRVNDVTGDTPLERVDLAKDQNDTHVKRHAVPFQHEHDVIHDPVSQRDEISEAQSDAESAAKLSGKHFSELLYTPDYIYDPRSSPQGVDYYPQYPDSKEV